MRPITQEKTDKQGYDHHYKGEISPMSSLKDPVEYKREYEATHLSPFYIGGTTKGYVRGLATQHLIQETDSKPEQRNRIRVLDAGSGLGELSVYLACLGFSVVGVDLSTEACAGARELASRLGVGTTCSFLAESLENISLPDSSVDFIIGHAALHHFIKYERVPEEFLRVLKPGARGFFADSFGENYLYHFFHNKQRMARLGDVPLSASLIRGFFSDFDVELTPTDWFVMLDKLYLKILPSQFTQVIRLFSKVHFWIDRRIASPSRTMLFLSGSVITAITKR